MQWNKRRFQKIISLLMAVIMCFSVMQGIVWASEVLAENNVTAESVEEMDAVGQDMPEKEAALEVLEDFAEETDAVIQEETDDAAALQNVSVNENDADPAGQDITADDTDAAADDTDAAADDTEIAADDTDITADDIIIEEISIVEEADTLDSDEYAELPSITLTYINPFYENVITEEDLVQPDPYGVSLLATTADYETYEDAVKTVHDQLKEKTETIVAMVKTTRTDFKQIAHDLMDDAMAHNGNPSEGDYLKWAYAGWSVSIGAGTYNDVYYVSFTYTITYYTTLAQEEEVTAVVADLLNELGLTEDGRNDYEKVQIIYDYICENVTYDYENLSDSDYKLKFTAYAALINKTAVCQGFALLFYRLALECGIDARLIPGNSQTHAWNIVKVGNKYYNLDATWDRQKTIDTYTYFLKSEEDFTGHTREDDYNTAAFHEAYPMSTTSYLTSEYQEGEGWIYDNGVLLITDDSCMCDYESETEQLWYEWKNKITEVVIADGITSVGAYAFTGCTSLTSVVIGEDVTSVGTYAFAGCTGLTSVVIGNSVTSIGSYAFSGCETLSEITIPDSVTSVGENAFEGADAISAVLKPDGTAYNRDEEDSAVADLFSTTEWYTHTHAEGTAVSENIIAATCAAAGSYDVVTYCTTCQLELNRTSEAIPATGIHTEKKPVQENMAAAACTKDGSYDMVVYCLVCGEELSRTTETVEATGHTETDAAVENEVDPTCTKNGSYDVAVYCTVCGEELSRITEILTAKGHTPVIDAAEAATCTTAGKTEGSHCSVCSEVLTAQEEVPAAGHKGEWITTAEATVFAPEQQMRTCTVCGETETREIGEAAKKFISFNVKSLRLSTGQTTNKFVVSYGNGDSIASWKLSKKNLVKVTQKKDGSLKIKALKKTGSVKLKITLESKISKTITIRVIAGKVATTSLKLEAAQKKITIKKGDTFKLLPIVKPITSQDKVKFTSSSKSIASVTSGGVVKGKKRGTAKITIRSGKKKVVCTVKVK